MGITFTIWTVFKPKLTILTPTTTLVCLYHTSLQDLIVVKSDQSPNLLLHHQIVPVTADRGCANPGPHYLVDPPPPPTST